MSGRLGAPYRKTEYRVQAGALSLSFYIGRYDPQAEGLLIEASGGFKRWAMVTPCNPGSVLLCEHENLARLENFRHALAALACRWLPCTHHDPAGAWPDEAGAMILDVARPEAMALGRQFQQAAIVYGKAGHAPELIWLDRPRTPDRAPAKPGSP